MQQAQCSAAGTTIRAGALTGIETALAPRGLRPEALCERRGVDPVALYDAEFRVPVARYVDLLEDAARSSGNAALGLQLGYAQPLSSIGPGAARIAAAPTVGAAVAALIADLPLHQDGVRIELHYDGPWASVAYAIDQLAGADYAQDAELSLAKMLAAVRRLSGNARWAPTQVHFAHAAPHDIAPQRGLFGAPVHYAQSCNALIFARELLAMPLGGATRASSGDLPPRPKPDLLAELKRQIMGQLADGSIAIDVVAARLGLSERTLQRRLRASGLSFQQLVEQLRFDTACRFLREGRLSLTEIGYRLGYSEPSAFSRAFRRWSGASPLAYRRQRVS